MQPLHILHLVFAAALVVIVAGGLLVPRRRSLSDADKAVTRITDRRSTVKHGRRATD